MPKNKTFTPTGSDDEILAFYANHSKQETIKKFNLDKWGNYLKRIIKKYNYKKVFSIQEKIENLNSDELYEYYVVEKHSAIETAKHFNIGKNSIHTVLNHFKLEKWKSFNTLKEELSKETLIDLYINKDMSHMELCSIYNVSWDVFHALCRFYGVSKIETRKKRKLKRLKDIGLDETKFKYLHIDKKLSCQYIADLYGISVGDLYKLRDKWGLHLHQPFNELLSNINPDDLYKYYIEENHGVKDTLKHFNIVSLNALPRLLKHYNIKFKCNFSAAETEIENYIKSINNNINILKNAKILNKKEVDLYIPDYKIAIEFNGTYWHCDAYKTKNYHQDKSKLAEQLGIRLIHIWSYEWEDLDKRKKILSILDTIFKNNITRLYARKCEIKEITNREAQIFNNENHLQGHRNAQLTYGLFHQGKLVQLMSFSKTKYNRNLKTSNSWEIIRECSLSNMLVIGGKSKLFAYFIKTHNPDYVFSYCDFNKFNGKSYEKLGMKFIGYTVPDMKWWLGKSIVVNRNPSKNKELSNIAKGKLYGAGNKKYAWRKEDHVQNKN